MRDKDPNTEDPANVGESSNAGEGNKIN